MDAALGRVGCASSAGIKTLVNVQTSGTGVSPVCCLSLFPKQCGAILGIVRVNGCKRGERVCLPVHLVAAGRKKVTRLTIRNGGTHTSPGFTSRFGLGCFRTRRFELPELYASRGWFVFQFPLARCYALLVHTGGQNKCSSHCQKREET